MISNTEASTNALDWSKAKYGPGILLFNAEQCLVFDLKRSSSGVRKRVIWDLNSLIAPRYRLLTPSKCSRLWSWGHAMISGPWSTYVKGKYCTFELAGGFTQDPYGRCQENRLVNYLSSLPPAEKQSCTTGFVYPEVGEHVLSTRKTLPVSHPSDTGPSVQVLCILILPEYMKLWLRMTFYILSLHTSAWESTESLRTPLWK